MALERRESVHLTHEKEEDQCSEGHLDGCLPRAGVGGGEQSDGVEFVARVNAADLHQIDDHTADGEETRLSIVMH